VSNIEFFFEDIPTIELHQKFAVNQIRQLIETENKKAGDISVIFCSDKYLLEINKNHLNHDYYTDIITFNYVEENLISGDLFISIERVRENAGKFDVTFHQELYRVILHGILHLVGYDDKTFEDQTLMREKENFYLEKIEF
jgi:rRNA maturation RNase YbeY